MADIQPSDEYVPVAGAVDARLRDMLDGKLEQIIILRNPKTGDIFVHTGVEGDFEQIRVED